jgi:hypothetical protein
MDRLLKALQDCKPDSEIVGTMYPGGTGFVHVNSEKRIIWESLDELWHTIQFWEHQAQQLQKIEAEKVA